MLEPVFIPIFVPLLALVAAAVLFARHRDVKLSVLILGWVPTGPWLAPVAFLFPGVGSPPDPSRDIPTASAPNTHTTSIVPQGIVVKSDPPAQRPPA